MYQIIVIGLAMFLLFCGAFYIKKSDNSGVLDQAFSSKKIDYKAPTVDDLVGQYKCDIDSGCIDESIISLTVEGDAQLYSVDQDNNQTLNEAGSWKLEKGGVISMLLADSSGNHNMLIQSVSTSTLSKFVYDKEFFSNMRKPVFSR